jgi:hypothetical protein
MIICYRFDLRLPYVDEGYYDPESDRLLKLRRFLGLAPKEPAETKAADKNAAVTKGKSAAPQSTPKSATEKEGSKGWKFW